jgi:EAL and modified HD-GYP domain-containing signal transduction protein
MHESTHPQVARQPIFDEKMEVRAYELLFRSGVDGVMAADNPDAATTGVVSASLFGIGTDRLTGTKLGFVNFPRKLVVGGYAALLSPQTIGIEILASVAPDDDVKAACRTLHEAGFAIAIDDMLPNDPRAALLPYASIVKIDFLSTAPEDRALVAHQCAGSGVELLGMRLESAAAVEEAKQLGCSLFQGYFFAEPEIVPGSEVPGNKLTHLRILSQVTRPGISVEEIEDLVKHDVALSFKLLRYINSAAFGWKREITSIRQALVMLGEREIRKWITLISLTSMGSDRPLELAVKSVTRGRMCELLAEPMGAPERSADLFFAGILSHLDALVSRPMEEALGEVYLPDDVRAALLREGGATLPGAALAIAESYERADWDRFSAICRRLEIPEYTVPATYLEAVEFGRELVHS